MAVVSDVLYFNLLKCDTAYDFKGVFPFPLNHSHIYASFLVQRSFVRMINLCIISLQIRKLRCVIGLSLVVP